MHNGPALFKEPANLDVPGRLARIKAIHHLQNVGIELESEINRNQVGHALQPHFSPDDTVGGDLGVSRNEMNGCPLRLGLRRLVGHVWQHRQQQNQGEYPG